MPNCPICRSTRSETRYRFDPARSIPSEVVRCSECGLLYKVLLPHALPLGDYYDDDYAESHYWEHRDAADRANDQILAQLKIARPSAAGSLLDVGCGAGDFMRRARDAGFEVTGLEMLPKLAQRARETSGAEVFEGDVMSADLGGRRFDVVTMLDLIEHLVDPVAALARCTQWLEPNGSLVLYTPNHSGAIVRLAQAMRRASGGRIEAPIVEIFDCTHVVFFDERTLAAAVRRAGLLVTHTASLAYDPQRSQQATGLVAGALRAVEWVAPLLGGRFRIVMVARQQ